MLQFFMYELKIKLKKLGKKRVQTLCYTLTQNVTSLEMLISEIVQQEVKKFNDKIDTPTMSSFLSLDTIEEKSKAGKVAFGELYNQEKAIEDEAIETALLAFKDGMFTVFVDEDEISDLHQPIVLGQESEVVFMRLTFLTGRY